MSLEITEVYTQALESIKRIDFTELTAAETEEVEESQIEDWLLSDLLRVGKRDLWREKIDGYLNLESPKNLGRIRRSIRLLIMAANIDGLAEVGNEIKEEYLRHSNTKWIKLKKREFSAETDRESNILELETRLRYFVREGDLEKAHICLEHLKTYFADQPIDFELLEEYISGESTLKQKTNKKKRRNCEISLREAKISTRDHGKIMNIAYFLINDFKYEDAYEALKLCGTKNESVVPSYRKLFLKVYIDGDYQLARKIFESSKDLFKFESRMHFRRLLEAVKPPIEAKIKEVYSIYNADEASNKFDKVVGILEELIAENIRPAVIVIRIFTQVEIYGDKEKGLQLCKIMKTINPDLAAKWQTRVDNWDKKEEAPQRCQPSYGRSALALGIQLEPVNKLAAMGMSRQKGEDKMNS